MDADEDFQRLDALMGAYEQEGGAGPVRMGEQAFSWEKVIELCEQLIQRGADIRVGIWWIKALIIQKALPELLIALQTMDQWFAGDVDHIHPLAEEGEDHRDTLALNLSFLGSTQFMASLGQVKLTVDSPTRLADLGLGAESGLLTGEVHQRLTLMLEVFQRLHSFLRGVESEQVYELDAPIQFLGQLLSQKKEEQITDTVSELAGKKAMGDIRSREDVASVLESLIRYFQQEEPGHPAPIFLERVQRMLGASFQDIMKELYADAPQLVSRIERPQGL